MDVEEVRKQKGEAERWIRNNLQKSMKDIEEDNAKIRLMKRLGVMTVCGMDTRNE